MISLAKLVTSPLAFPVPVISSAGAPVRRPALLSRRPNQRFFFFCGSERVVDGLLAGVPFEFLALYFIALLTLPSCGRLVLVRGAWILVVVP